jgi:hypothetical protein
MNEQEEKRITALLKQAIMPVERELDRDLWPKMLRRVSAGEWKRQWLTVLFSPVALSAVPWFDWVLLGILVAGVCAFPRSIPIWLYHF